MEQHYLKLYKIITIISSVCCFVFFSLAAIEEQITAEWKGHQKQFKKILASEAKTALQKTSAATFTMEIKQNVLPELQRVDRCISCHNGIENPSMEKVPLPHTIHSGNYLQNHPIEKFGCTICHQGQGRALTFHEVAAYEEDVHWEYPLLPKENTQATCVSCHLSAFDTSQILDEADVVMKGRKLFLENGCLSCHKVRSLGSSIGVELTDGGMKTIHEFDFTHISGEKTVQNWLKEHFKNPQQFTHDSKMPKIQLNDDALNALTTFVMGLKKPRTTPEHYTLEYIQEFKGKRIHFSGEESYQYMCAPCHGEDGKGKDYRIFEEAVPALNNADFLAVASSEMIRQTIQFGREGRIMPSWVFDMGGLSKDEITDLTNYIMQWKQKAPSFENVLAVQGNTTIGKTIFRASCGICHGPEGEGGIGTSIHNQDFLPLVTNEFLYKTIVNGRENTAMLSWNNFDASSLAHIITYLKSWQKVDQLSLDTAKIIGNRDNGKSLYEGICTQCHGVHGQGTVGPALFNKNFLTTASDHFIFETTSKGRENTAMVSWSRNLQGMAQLSEREIQDVVSFIRSQEKVIPEKLHSNIVSGTVTGGHALFQGMCGSCHGYKGEGKHGPALNNQSFLNASTNGFLQATIAFGRKNTAMRAWAKGSQGYAELSESDINDVISYVRNWQKQ